MKNLWNERGSITERNQSGAALLWLLVAVLVISLGASLLEVRCIDEGRLSVGLREGPVRREISHFFSNAASLIGNPKVSASPMVPEPPTARDTRVLQKESGDPCEGYDPNSGWVLASLEELCSKRLRRASESTSYSGGQLTRRAQIDEVYGLLEGVGIDRELQQQVTEMLERGDASPDDVIRMMLTVQGNLSQLRHSTVKAVTPQRVESNEILELPAMKSLTTSLERIIGGSRPGG